MCCSHRGIPFSSKKVPEENGLEQSYEQASLITDRGTRKTNRCETDLAHKAFLIPGCAECGDKATTYWIRAPPAPRREQAQIVGFAVGHAIL